MKFTTPYPNAAKTEDLMYCRDCCFWDHANESPESITCALCDSENVITKAQRNRELQQEYDNYFDDARDEKRMEEIRSDPNSCVNMSAALDQIMQIARGDFDVEFGNYEIPSYSPNFLRKKQAGG